MGNDPADPVELIYPFVVCTSNGGPYDDEAFVAGVRFGVLMYRMLRDDPIIQDSTFTELLPQLDLAAMHSSYTLTSALWTEDPKWCIVCLRKITS